MKQLDGGQKYFRMWIYTEKAAKKLEEEGFSTGYYDYEVSDWLTEMQDLVLKAWAKDTPVRNGRSVSVSDRQDSDLDSGNITTLHERILDGE